MQKTRGDGLQWEGFHLNRGKLHRGHLLEQPPQGLGGAAIAGGIPDATGQGVR